MDASYLTNLANLQLTGIPHKFIVVEGADGSGKTTLSKRLQEAIPNSIWTCEMSDGVIGKLIRDMFTKKIAPVDRLTMATLFTADRLDHIANTILPAIQAGKTVICDRYYYSTFVYQKFYEEDQSWFNALTQTPPIMMPDVTLVISVDAETALARLNSRAVAKQLLEDDATQADVCDAYRILDIHFPKDWIIHIDGNQSADAVYRDAVAALYRLPWGKNQKASQR